MYSEYNRATASHGKREQDKGGSPGVEPREVAIFDPGAPVPGEDSGPDPGDPGPALPHAVHPRQSPDREQPNAGPHQQTGAESEQGTTAAADGGKLHSSV